MNTIKLNTIGEAPIKKGGASGGGGGGNYVYYRASVSEMGGYAGYSSVVKANFKGTNVFLPFVDAQNIGMDILEWGFDTNLKITNPENMTMTTVGDFIAEPSKNWTQITEEEFYKIPTQFTFILDGEPKWYDYKEGMTWGEWIDSPYNDGNFSVHDANMGEGIQEYVHYKYSAITYNEYYYVKPTDLIQPNMNYVVNNQVG